MNIRISAIATSVMLVTVMPRNSRSILSLNRQTPLRTEPERGAPYTENGTQYPGQVYSEVNTPLTIDASGISGADISQARRRQRAGRSRDLAAVHQFSIVSACLWVPSDSTAQPN